MFVALCKSNKGLFYCANVNTYILILYVTLTIVYVECIFVWMDNGEHINININ